MPPESGASKLYVLLINQNTKDPPALKWDEHEKTSSYSTGARAPVGSLMRELKMSRKLAVTRARKFFYQNSYYLMGTKGFKMNCTHFTNKVSLRYQFAIYKERTHLRGGPLSFDSFQNNFSSESAALQSLFMRGRVPL